MKSSTQTNFKQNYLLLHKHLKAKGLMPKTVEAYSRTIRRIGKYSVKLDLHGLKFYYRHVLNTPWTKVELIQPPTAHRIPDILTVDEAARLFATTRILSYRVFYFSVYSMGLRLGEGIRLRVGDIDAERMRVHIRNAKGNKDRLVPMPDATLTVLRQFWQIHRNPRFIFPNRKRGLSGSGKVSSPLDRGGIQTTIRKVVDACGLKKRSQPTVCAIAMPPI